MAQFRGRVIRPKFRRWEELASRHRGGISRNLVFYHAFQGIIEATYPDLGHSTPHSERVWTAIAGAHSGLQEFGDIALPDGSTQYHSYIPASGFPPELFPGPGELQTWLWFGEHDNRIDLGGIMGGGNGTSTNMQGLYSNINDLKTIERSSVGSLQRVKTYASITPDDQELVCIIARFRPSDTDVTVEGITSDGTIGGDAIINPGPRDYVGFLVNANLFSVPFFIQENRTYCAGLWDRWLTDPEVAGLTADPFLPIRPDAEYDVAAHLELIRRPLPCPGYPVSRELRLPQDQSEGQGGTIILADRPPRVTSEIVSLRYDNLDQDEQVALEFAYDEGRGLARAFRFTVPGDSGPTLFVFDEPIRIGHGSAMAGTSEVKLRVVSPPDWQPAPSILAGTSITGTTSSPLILTPVDVAAADIALVALGFVMGASRVLDEYQWRPANPARSFKILVHASIGVAGREESIGVRFDAAEDPGGSAQLRAVYKGAGPSTAQALTSLIVRGVKAVNATATVELLDPAGLTPTLAIVTTIDDCLIVFGAHATFDVAGAAMSVATPIRQHTLDETPLVTEEWLTGSLYARKAGTHTITIAVTGAATADVRIVAVALEPQDLPSA